MVVLITTLGLDNIADLNRLLPEEAIESNPNPYSLWISSHLREKYAGSQSVIH